MPPLAVVQPMIKKVMVVQLVGHVDVTYPNILFFGHVQAEESECGCFTFVFIIHLYCFFNPFNIFLQRIKKNGTALCHRLIQKQDLDSLDPQPALLL